MTGLDALEPRVNKWNVQEACVWPCIICVDRPTKVAIRQNENPEKSLERDIAANPPERVGTRFAAVNDGRRCGEVVNLRRLYVKEIRLPKVRRGRPSAALERWR